MAGKPETPVTKPLRTGIKNAGYVAQIARLIELMPTPQDFATRICGDIIYMSSLIQKFVQDINKVLDGYSNIPWDYLNNQLYSITDSVNNTLNRAQAYTDYVVDSTLGLAQNTLEISKELTDGVLDVSSHTAQAVSSFGAAISSTNADIIGNHDVADSIRDGVEKFEKTHDTECLKNALEKVTDAEARAKGFINNTFDTTTDAVNKGMEFVQKIIDRLKASVDKMSKDVDDAFGGIIQSDKITTTLDTVHNGLQGYDKAMASQATGAMAGAVSEILKNFSIGKFISAFLGVATNTVLISTGLNELPPINIDKMLSEFQGKLNQTNLSGLESDVSFDDLIEYDSTKYTELKKSFETFLQQQREEILKKKKNIFNVRTSEAKAYAKASKGWYNNMSKKERKELKSVINEIKKKRDQTKKAKTSKKLKDVALQELKKIQEECKKFSNRLKDEWDAMIKEYEKSIKQVKDFFTSGTGDQYIEDLCYDINQNVDNIVQLCTVDMPVEIAGSSTKAALPYCFGMAVPNFAHNVVSFIVDVKVILKFIMDLIKYVMNIIDDINKLARLFLNGLKKLFDILHQLLDLLGLGWLMDLVKDIVDLFKNKVNDTCQSLEGSLSPVYLGGTKMRETWENEINFFIEEIKNIKLKNPTIKFYSKKSDDILESDPTLYIYNNLSHLNGLLIYMGVEPIDINSNNDITDGNINPVLEYRFSPNTDTNLGDITGYFNPTGYFDTDGFLKELNRKLGQIDSNYIVAYRSPKFGKTEIIKDTDFDFFNTTISTGTMYDPSNIEKWIYYHPNLRHLGYDLEFTNIHGEISNYNKVNGEYDNNYYNEYMLNASRVPNNEWMHKVIRKNTTGNWKQFDVDGNSQLVAYELFYWYSDNINDDNWARIKFPDGNYDEYFDPEKTIINSNIIINNKTNDDLKIWLYDYHYIINSKLNNNKITKFNNELTSDMTYKLAISKNPSYEYKLTNVVGTQLNYLDDSDYIIWNFDTVQDENLSEDEIIKEISIEIDITKIDDDGNVISDDDPFDDDPLDNIPDSNDFANLIKYSEKGSVVRIFITQPNSTKKISKLVWVKDKILKSGDIIVVEGRYYKLK